jgi:hypothetical protein
MSVQFFISIIKKAGPSIFVNYESFGWFKRFCYFFGPHDWPILGLGILLGRSILKASNKVIKTLSWVIFLFLFIYIFPQFSAVLESQRYVHFNTAEGGFVDGFELLYVFFKFPLYWLMGLVILLINTKNLGGKFRRILNIQD